MLQNARRSDSSFFLLCAGYTLSAFLYPFPAVALPKLVISELTGAQRAEYILFIAAGFFIISGALGFISALLEEFGSVRATKFRMGYVRDEYARILRMDYPYCEDSAFNDKCEKAFKSTSNNISGVEAVYTSLYKLPSLALTVAAFAVFIGAADPLILLAIILNIAAVTLISRKTHNYRFSNKERLGHAERRINYLVNTTHDFSFGKDIRLYGLRERVADNLRREISGYTDIIALISRREFCWGFLGLFTLALSDVATYGLLANKVVEGMSIADFSMYVAAAASLSLTLKKLSKEFTSVINEGEYCAELFAFLDADLTGRDGTRGPIEGDTLEIELRDVSFKYPRSEKYIYEHLNLKIKKGERLALVGVNGAGKSTLVKLITGLFTPTSGEIFINGIPAKEFSREALFSMFSVVFQEVNVVAFTVLENVACSSDGSRERAKAALEKAGLWDKIASLPKGLDTMMLKVVDGEGAVLSGGEMQKLAIARALYKNADMVIMDEPTAALDALAEQEIYERFNELTGGKTSLYISHRLASTRFCDRIILIDGARIAEEGSHDELMLRRGKYYEMFAIQGKYYSSPDRAEGSEK